MAITSTITTVTFMLGFVGAKFVDAKPSRSYPEPQTKSADDKTLSGK